MNNRKKMLFFTLCTVLVLLTAALLYSWHAFGRQKDYADLVVTVTDSSVRLKCPACGASCSWEAFQYDADARSFIDPVLQVLKNKDSIHVMIDSCNGTNYQWGEFYEQVLRRVFAFLKPVLSGKQQYLAINDGTISTGYLNVTDVDVGDALASYQLKYLPRRTVGLIAGTKGNSFEWILTCEIPESAGAVWEARVDIQSDAPLKTAIRALNKIRTFSSYIGIRFYRVSAVPAHAETMKSGPSQGEDQRDDKAQEQKPEKKGDE